MTDHPPAHPTYLTRSGERAMCAQALDAATGASMEVALLAADTLDLVAQAVLSAFGMPDPAEQRAALAVLWGPGAVSHTR